MDWREAGGGGKENFQEGVARCDDALPEGSSCAERERAVHL